MISITPGKILDFKVARRSQLTKSWRRYPNRCGGGWQRADSARYRRRLLQLLEIYEVWFLLPQGIVIVRMFFMANTRATVRFPSP
jgi:hypothetical protein